MFELSLHLVEIKKLIVTINHETLSFPDLSQSAFMILTYPQVGLRDASPRNQPRFRSHSENV